MTHNKLCKLVASPTGFNLYISWLLFHFYNLAPLGSLTTPVFPVTAVTVSLDGWERTVTWTGMTVCQVLARMLAHASTSSMVSLASVVKASEVREWRSSTAHSNC